MPMLACMPSKGAGRRVSASRAPRSLHGPRSLHPPSTFKAFRPLHLIPGRPRLARALVLPQRARRGRCKMRLWPRPCDQGHRGCAPPARRQTMLPLNAVGAAFTACGPFPNTPHAMAANTGASGCKLLFPSASFPNVVGAGRLDRATMHRRTRASPHAAMQARAGGIRARRG